MINSIFVDKHVNSCQRYQDYNLVKISFDLFRSSQIQQRPTLFEGAETLVSL